MKERKTEGAEGTFFKNDTTRREFLKSTASMAASAWLGSALMSGCGRSSSGGYDVVIKNGTIYDGTLAEPYKTDIAIVGDRIVRIGKVDSPAIKVIDAENCIVTPGFIDVHEHTDYNFIVSRATKEDVKKSLEWSGSYNDIFQGITTVVSGNCGFGYTDMNEYFSFLDEVRLGTNSCYLTPHGVLRLELFGDNQPGALTAGQLNALKSMVAREMEKGAIGLSSGLGYVSGSFTERKADLECVELVELAKVVKSYDGIYATHIREDPSALRLPKGGNPENLNGVKEAITVGRKTGVRVQISHIQCNVGAAPGDVHDLLTAIEDARAEGIDVTLDQYPYLAGGQNITVLADKKCLSCTTGDGGRVGFSIREEYKKNPLREEMRLDVEKTFNTGLTPDLISVSYKNEVTGKEYIQRPLSEISAGEGCSASEMWARLACGDKEHPDPPATIMRTVDEASMKIIMPQPYVFTGGDGGALPLGSGSLHPRVYGTFPKKLRTYGGLDPKAPTNLMSLRDAIRSMTSLPAAKFQIRQRGTIAVGNFADIAVIDKETYADRATFEAPTEYAVGVMYLLVNGVLAIDHGIATGLRGGVTLRRT